MTLHFKDMNQHTAPLLGQTKRDIALQSYTKDKCTRIASVLCSITGLMDKDSLMRGALEKTSIDLTKDAAMSAMSQAARDDVVGNLYTLTALLSVAGESGRVALSSAQVLGDECRALVNFLAEAGYVNAASALDPRQLHSTPTDTAFETYTHKRPVETYVGHVAVPEVPQQGHAAVRAQTDMQESRGVAGKQVSAQYRERVQESQKDRRAVILSLLQRKDRVNVKDVAQVIKDVSEKTIQRELLALVAQGVLVKEGERRWSTYRLA